jgi:hypothetical protein
MGNYHPTNFTNLKTLALAILLYGKEEEKQKGPHVLENRT